MEHKKLSFWGKLRLFWQFEYRYYPQNFVRGIKNLIKWGPVIWKDRDWDDTFLFEIIKFKLSNMSESHGKTMPYVGYERNVEIMNTIVRLIEKLSDDYEMKIKNLRDDLDEYFTKYPLLKNRATKHKIYQSNPSSVRLAMAMGFVQHERAKGLIFELLNRHVDKWWE